MKSEAEPITDDEWLLRRVNKDRFRTAQTPLISPGAFEPRVKGRDPDVDGISFYRASCLESAEAILTSLQPPKREETGIVRMQVSSLARLELSVQPKPIPTIPGHVVIPEMNSIDYPTQKSEIGKQMLGLAEIASEDENIVRWPNSLP